MRCHRGTKEGATTRARILALCLRLHILEIIASGIFLLVMAPSVQATETAWELTILYTNDVRGNLDPCGCAKEQLGDISTRAALVRSLRASAKNVIVVDSGDAFSDASLFNTFDRARRELIMDAMAYMGYDYLNVGDTELGFGLPVLKEIQGMTRFKLLSANILDRTRQKPVFFPYAIHQVGALRVALIGLVTDRIPKRIPSEYLQNLSFADPIAVAQGYVSVLKEQSDLLVAIAHLGLEQEKELARKIPQIDVVIGGHSGHTLETPVEIGKTLVLEGGDQGQYVGKLVLKLSKAKEVVSYEHELVPVNSLRFPADQHVQRLRRAYRKQEKKGNIYDKRDRRKSFTFSLEKDVPED